MPEALAALASKLDERLAMLEWDRPALPPFLDGLGRDPGERWREFCDGVFHAPQNGDKLARLSMDELARRGI
jgi:hypothetical protein